MQAGSKSETSRRGQKPIFHSRYSTVEADMHFDMNYVMTKSTKGKDKDTKGKEKEIDVPIPIMVGVTVSL